MIVIDKLILYSNAVGIQKVITGLVNMERLGYLRIRDVSFKALNVNHFYGVQYIKFYSEGQCVFLDFEDPFEVCTIPDLVSDVTIYFKRSLQKDRVYTVPYRLYPLGTNEVVHADFEWRFFIPELKAAFDQKNLKYFLACRVPVLSRISKINNGVYFTNYKKLRRTTIQGKEKRILFSTRLWDPVKARDEAERERRILLNHSRINTFIKLRETFGDQVSGGILTEFCPGDWVDPQYQIDRSSFNRQVYERSLAKSSIGFVSHGHHWVGFSVGEFLLNSMVPFIDSLTCELPYTLVEGQDYFTYDSADDAFLNHIKDLFNRPDYLREKQVHAWNLYLQYFSPEAMCQHIFSKIMQHS
jgi:hypothetical protein